jgi:hypothetical protein
MATKEQAVLEVRVTGVDQGAKQFQDFQKTTTRAMSDSEAAVARSLSNMVAQFVGVAAAARAVKSVISSGVGFNQFVENTTTSFTVMMKSAEKAKAQMKDLYDFAVNSPLTFKETASSSKQLMAYGFAAEELIPTMQTLGSVAIATGHSLDDISYVYGTLKSQGQAYSRDLMQFGMRGIPIYEELAKVMETDVSQIQKMASEGKIGFKEVETAFQNMTTNGGRFSGIIEGYMTTLTGKLSALGDIAQQSFGTLMLPVTDALKQFVESLTKTLKSSAFQAFATSAGSDIGVLASALGKVISGIITILPLLQTMLRIFIAFAAVQIWFKLPAILMSMASGIAAISAGTLTATSASVGLGYAWDKVAVSIASSAGALGTLLLPIAAITLAIGGISNAIAEAAREAKMVKDSAYFEAEIVKQAQGQTTGGGGVSISGFALKDQVWYIEKMAERYGKSADEVAQILYFSKLISAETATAAGFSVDAWVAEQKMAQQAERTVKALGDRKFVSTLEAVGLQISSWDTYVEDFQKSASFLKDPKAFEGVAKMAEPSINWKETSILENLPSLDIVSEMINAGANTGAVDSQTKAILKQRVDLLTQYLTSLIQRDIANPTDQNPELKAWLAKQLNDAQKAIDALGKETEKSMQSLGTWWTPIVQAAKLTASELDDIQISTNQALEASEKEYNTRINTYEANLKIVSSDLERARIQALITQDTAAFLQLQKDITAEGIKQQGLKSYTYATQGNAAYFENLKAEAGKAYAAGDIGRGINAQATSSAEGTEAGSLLSGADPIAMAIKALADFALSIKNVNALLNPFSTVLEAMRPLLEPLVNNVLQPIVNVLQMIGGALSTVFLPILSALKVQISLWYIALTPLISILQLVSAGFTALYDNVLVVIANKIIIIVNMIIYMLNKIPFVTIKYIDSLQTSTEALNASSGKIVASMQYAADKLNGLVDDQVKSWQDLYEVGAVSATDYQKAIQGLNAQKIDLNPPDIDKALESMSTIEEFTTWIKANMAAYTAATNATSDYADTMKNTDQESEDVFTKFNTLLSDTISVFATFKDNLVSAARAVQSYFLDLFESAGDIIGGFGGGIGDFFKQLPNALASMISNIASWVSNSMGSWASSVFDTAIGWIKDRIDDLIPFANGTANLTQTGPIIAHKGEGIIPATFMDSIRSGELALSSGRNEGSGQNIYVSVTVEGSVTTEEELVTAVAQGIYMQRKSGLLTV